MSDALIFDRDGPLADSLEWMTETARNALTVAGEKVPPAEQDECRMLSTRGSPT